MVPANSRLFISSLAALLLGACTSVNVRPIDSAAQLVHACIRDNPKVIVSDFVDVLRDGFERHAISTEVFSGAAPSHCEYIVTYTALRSWDFSPYLSHAEVRIERGGRIVASAEYHLKGKGGLSLAKWQGTKSKMDPVIDQLLQGAKST